jgi:hypothetical protein
VNINSPGTYPIDYSAKDSSGNVSTKVTRTVTILTGMNDIAKDLGMSAWPNPCKDMLNIGWQDASTTVTEFQPVSDVSGRRVMTSGWRANNNWHSIQSKYPNAARRYMYPWFV